MKNINYNLIIKKKNIKKAKLFQILNIIKSINQNISNNNIRTIIKNSNSNKINNKKISLFSLININIFIILSLISNILCIESNLNKQRNLQSSYSQITLRINGKGTNQILYNNFRPMPDYLEVNSIKTNFNYIINNLQYQENNKIVMRWNNILTSCENMFYGLSNITQIELNNFDFSEVTSMKGMFFGNKNLWNIKFNTDIKITKIKNLENMFNGCNILESLDLSIFDTSLVTNMAFMFKYCFKL